MNKCAGVLLLCPPLGTGGAVHFTGSWPFTGNFCFFSVMLGVRICGPDLKDMAQEDGNQVPTAGPHQYSPW